MQQGYLGRSFIDDQHESDKGDSISKVSKVLVKPNLSQIHVESLICLMNYLMIIGTGELQGLTVKASRLVKLEITSCVKQKR